MSVVYKCNCGFEAEWQEFSNGICPRCRAERDLVPVENEDNMLKRYKVYLSDKPEIVVIGHGKEVAGYVRFENARLWIVNEAKSLIITEITLDLTEYGYEIVSDAKAPDGMFQKVSGGNGK